MKGTPPFTRPAAVRSSMTASSGGLRLILRKASRTALYSADWFVIVRTATTVWLILRAPGLRLGFRIFDEPNGFSGVNVHDTGKGPLVVKATGNLGKYNAVITWSETDTLSLRATVSLRPSGSVELGKLPRQICLMDSRLNPLERGLVYTTQTGPTAGQTFVSAQDTYVFYFQNLSAISTYANLTAARLEGSVGVAWPELGFTLPIGEKPLSSRRAVVLSDAFIRINSGVSASESDCACRFIDDLHATYLQLQSPPVEWYDWEAMAARTVRDLSRSKKCLRTIAGVPYLNPYVGCTSKPPESMVQAAVIVPLIEYETWLGKPLPLVKRLDRTLLAFYGQKIGSIIRWLPGVPFNKEEPSEEEDANRVDSWYLFHSLMNFGRLAEMARAGTMDAFLNSLRYAIHTAHHFDYDWPVFFNQKTLEVDKAETDRGAGGEQDTPGLYAHVMIQAWRLTRDPVYLEEAEIAATKLRGLGFGILYQTNNTMFSAIALAWLWKETGNILYKDLSFVSMGSILSHLWMWEAEQPGRPWQTFMGLPPLHDAPYIAAYEEGEIYACTAAYLDAMGPDAPAALASLLVEYGKRLLHRARFYFPSELPADSVSTEPKEGSIEPELAIPVEDLYPSADKSGQVGQEVYGAALALILATRSYHQWDGVPFRLWCNGRLLGPEFENKSEGEGTLRFSLAGVSECEYEIRILPTSRKEARMIFSVRSSPGSTRSPDKQLRYRANGGQEIEINWRPNRRT